MTKKVGIQLFEDSVVGTESGSHIIQMAVLVHSDVHRVAVWRLVHLFFGQIVSIELRVFHFP